MQRKPTKNTRGPNASERSFQAWLKHQPCCVTGKPGPSIVHHCEGATFKHNKVLVGHWFCIPLCQEVDDVVTRGSRKAFRLKYGPQSHLCLEQLNRYQKEMRRVNQPKSPCGGGSVAHDYIDNDVWFAIKDWGK